MASNSSILAWKTPWTEEAGGLQSTGSQRVRYHWATHARLQIVKWQWFRILATSHRLPSSKTDISSHLLCPPLSFQKVCSSKLQTGIQPAEMQRGLSVQWAWLYQGCRAVTQVAPHPAHEQRSGKMFLLWEWVILSPSFLSRWKSSLCCQDSLL